MSANSLSMTKTRYFTKQILQKIRLAFICNPITEKEFSLMVDAWEEVLRSVNVPPERINECYLNAFKEHKSNYPMTVYEIVDAWRLIQESEKSRKVIENYVNRPCLRCEWGDISGIGPCSEHRS